ncbi:MAG: hypothetical protein H7274_12470 [Rhodoferax sp.]|nr:hypothetical protein [Rhodoferax sp.]
MKKARDATGHHHVRRYRAFHLFNAFELQRVDAQAVRQDMKEHLDFPARPALWGCMARSAVSRATQ